MLIVLLRIANQMHHRKAAAAMCQRLLMRLSSCRIVSGELPVRDSSFWKTGFTQVMSNKLWLTGDHIRVAFFKNGCDPGVMLLAAALE